jgi:hypothetical protein
MLQRVVCFMPSAFVGAAVQVLHSDLQMWEPCYTSCITACCTTRKQAAQPPVVLLLALLAPEQHLEQHSSSKAY